MPMTAMADQGHSDGLTALRDRDLDDLDRHCSDPDILGEKRIGYMVGDRLNQREMEIAWDRLQGSISKIQIVLGEAKRRLGSIFRRRFELRGYCYEQWLRKVRFFRVDSGEQIDGYAGDLKAKKSVWKDVSHSRAIRTGI